ncbi:MAG: hypothetical protein GPJ54_17445 [Candidatus Heimdallarchaeota archaeon]|nr:hypothetical protein [Candidatus Heimdallarchaeota archaeon]
MDDIPLLWKLMALTTILSSLLLLVYYFKRQTRPHRKCGFPMGMGVSWGTWSRREMIKNTVFSLSGKSI